MFFCLPNLVHTMSDHLKSIGSVSVVNEKLDTQDFSGIYIAGRTTKSNVVFL